MPDPIDVEVGKRMRARRKALGATQLKVAGALNITFQQVQKYEKGANRVSASRLARIADLLQVPISFFFNDTFGAEPADEVMDFVATTDGHRLNAAFARIGDAVVRTRVINLVRAIADGHEGGSSLPHS